MALAVTHKHTATTFIPKMFLAAFSLASFVKSIPAWGWADIWFTFMVLVGVVGESSWARNLLRPLVPLDHKWEWFKKKSEGILAIGLAGEIFCLACSLWDSANLNQDTARLKLKISTNELEVAALNLKAEKLRKENDELLENSMPMSLGDEQAFADALHEIPSINVIVANKANDFNAWATADRLKRTLFRAGWNVLNKFDETNEYAAGIVIRMNEDATEKLPATRAAHLLDKLFASINLPSSLDIPTNGQQLPPNELVVVVGQRPDLLTSREEVFEAMAIEAMHDAYVYGRGHPNPTPADKSQINRLINLSMNELMQAAMVKVESFKNKGFSNNPSVIIEGRHISVLMTNGVPISVYVHGDFPFCINLSNGAISTVDFPTNLPTGFDNFPDNLPN